MTGPSFRFRLERVHALREHSEDVAKQDLAVALTRRTESELQLTAADERLNSAHTDQRSGSNVALTATDLIARQAYLERAEGMRTAAARELTTKDQDVARRRAVVDRAVRERKVLDRLKDRRRVDHDAQVAHREGALLDEVALNLFRRQAA